MLKGHVCIELHDKKTGLRDRIEGDNLVTNALTDICKLVPESECNMNQFLPASTKAYGGLFLFDGALNDNPDDFTFPTDIHLMGYGDRGVSTADAYKGSLNSVETMATENGYRHVWDFGTSQANGTIRSLALTHSEAAKFLFDKHISNSFAIRGSGVGQFSNRVTLKYDKTAQTMYYLYWAASGSRNRTINVSVRSRHIPLRAFKVRETRGTYSAETVVSELEHTYDYDYPLPYSVYYTTPGYNIHQLISIDRNAGKAYLHYWDNSGTHNTILSVFAVDLSTFAITFTETDTGYDLKNNEPSSIKILGNYLYIAFSSGILRKYNLSNPAIVTQTTGEPPYMICNIGDAIFAQYGLSSSAYTNSCLRYSDGTIVRSLETFRGAYCKTHNPFDDIIYANQYDNNSSYTNSLSIRRDYLGTKYNLPSAVVKNSSQTMKVIYTLTDAG